MVVSLAYNTTRAPVLVDSTGFSIGGGEWGVIDTLDEQARRVLDSGAVIVADEDRLRAERGDDPFVSAVLIALDARRVLEEQVSSLDKDTLLAAADPDTVAALPVGGDGKPSKADLVDAVVAEQTAEGADEAPETEAAPKKATARKTATKKSTTSRDAAK